MKSFVQLMVLSILVGIMGCAPVRDSAVPVGAEQLPVNGPPDWQRYIGQYPRSADLGQQPYGTPLLLMPAIQTAMARAFAPEILAEIASLTVETPIESLDSDYLHVHLCEAHNCPHAVDLLIDVTNLRMTLLVHQVMVDPPSKATSCYSNQVSRLGELADGVKTQLRQRLFDIPEAADWFDDVACYPQPLR